MITYYYKGTARDYLHQFHAKKLPVMSQSTYEKCASCGGNGYTADIFDEQVVCSKCEGSGVTEIMPF